MPDTFLKDPNAVLEYINDWSDWLNGDTIATSTWTVPTGITKDSSTNTTTTATIWLSGGTVGENYTAVNHIVTTAGRAEDRSLYFTIVQR